MSQRGSQTRPIRPSALRRVRISVSLPALEHGFLATWPEISSRSPFRAMVASRAIPRWVRTTGRDSLRRNLTREAIHETFVFRVSPLLVRSHASGLFRRPAALGLLLRLRALRVSVPPKGRPPKKSPDLRHPVGGRAPARSGSRQWVTRPHPGIQQRRLHHVSESHLAHRIPRQ